MQWAAGVPDAAVRPPTHERAGPRPPDGRRARWTEHRRARRAELTAAAVEAVRLAGPAFAVDAVLERISTVVLVPRLLGELVRDHPDDRARLHAVIAAFVALIEEEPALYRFAYAHAGRSDGADLVSATEREIAEALAHRWADRLAEAGRSTAAAATWAYGVVGMVQLSVHWWTRSRAVPAGDLVEQLTALAHGGLAAVLPPAAGRESGPDPAVSREG